MAFSKILKRFRDIGENKSLDSDLALCSILFYVDFSFSISFQYFYSEKKPSKSEQKYYADNIKCTQCWEFQSINDYRSRNGKRSNCATFYKIICYIRARIKHTVCNRKINSFGKDITNKNTYTGPLIYIINKISMIYKIINRNKEESNN